MLLLHDAILYDAIWLMCHIMSLAAKALSQWVCATRSGPDMALLPAGVAAGADRLLHVVQLLEPAVHSTVEVKQTLPVYLGKHLETLVLQTHFTALHDGLPIHSPTLILTHAKRKHATT